MNKLIRVLLVAFFVAAVSMTIANAAGVGLPHPT
jgi:hypothetical protein